MSLAIVYTRARLGVEAPLITVEVHLSNGLPGLSIVGMPEAVVRESKDRVRSALINSNFEFPSRRITINLAPADLPKDGSRFDLAIAIGILAASEQIQKNCLNSTEFVGELALSGELRGIHGVLPAAIACGKAQHQLMIANENAAEAALCEGTETFAAPTLLSVCEHLDRQTLSSIVFSYPDNQQSTPNLNEVCGQQHAKRGLEIAAAGGHNLLLYGPPGTGKTMLASRLPSIMPMLSQEQAIEVASIYSLCGHPTPLWKIPPFRNPHHTASSVALVGGGSHPKPGEISLAHYGVLFLDELPEFQRQVLEVLREPLESGEIRISRATAQLNFPAQFQLVAAMNPCPCGYLGNNDKSKKHCSCTKEQIQKYRQKISGPLLDRIDLHIPVNNLSIKELSQPKNTQNRGESSSEIQTRVICARERQLKRQGCTNAKLNNCQLEKVAQLGEAENNVLHNAVERLGLSARAYHRIIKVARTIADLAGVEYITSEHLAESLSLRNFDRS